MYRLVYLFAICLFFADCSGEQADQDTANAATENVAPVSANDQGSASEKMHFSASHEAPYCRLWVIKFAAEVENPEDYKGRWFNLKRDNTFETGQWQETTNHGQWNIGENTNILNLMFNDPTDFPPRWELQGAGGGGRIIWKGNVIGNEEGYQLMVEPEEVLPVKP